MDFTQVLQFAHEIFSGSVISLLKILEGEHSIGSNWYQSSVYGSKTVEFHRFFTLEKNCQE